MNRSPGLNSNVTEGRPTCYSCFRPESHCCCGLAERFNAHCNILVLQHPNEWRKYYGTVKVLKDIVLNCSILRGVNFNQTEFEISLDGRQPLLLFPRHDAKYCTDIEVDRSHTLVVVDGTWAEASKIVYRNSFLSQLPAVSFAQAIESTYRIRKQPKLGCLSTLESVAYALLQMRGSNEADLMHYDALLDAFDRVVEFQLQYWPSRNLSQK